MTTPTTQVIFYIPIDKYTGHIPDSKYCRHFHILPTMGLGWLRVFDRLFIVLGHWTVTAELRYQIFHILKNWINSLRWRHNGRDSVSYHQPHDFLLNRLFRRRSKKIPKLRVSGHCVGNSSWTFEFPAQMASNAKMFPFDDVIMFLTQGIPKTFTSFGFYQLTEIKCDKLCSGMYVGSSIFTTCRHGNAS